MKKVFDLVLFFPFLLVSIFLWFAAATIFFPLRLIFKKNILNKFSDWLYSHRQIVSFQRQEIIKRIKKGARVLDVGSGRGYLAKAIAEKKGAKLICTDVVDHHKTDLPFKLFDGVSLPFKDKSYDFVVLSYVLHHAQDPQKLLKECRRVCRGRVLVLEDKPVLFLPFFAKAHQLVYNLIYNLCGKVIYHSPFKWRKIFENCGFEVVENESKWGIGAVVAPMKKVIFVLKPGEGARIPHFRGDVRPELGGRTKDALSLTLRKTARVSDSKKRAGDSGFSEHSEMGIARLFIF